MGKRAGTDILPSSTGGHFLPLLSSVRLLLLSLRVIFSASPYSGERMSHFISHPSSNTFLKKKKQPLNRFVNALWNIWFTRNLYLFSAPAAQRGSPNSQSIDMCLSWLKLLSQNAIDWVAQTTDIISHSLGGWQDQR